MGVVYIAPLTMRHSKNVGDPSKAGIGFKMTFVSTATTHSLGFVILSLLKLDVIEKFTNM